MSIVLSCLKKRNTVFKRKIAVPGLHRDGGTDTPAPVADVPGRAYIMTGDEACRRSPLATADAR